MKMIKRIISGNPNITYDDNNNNNNNNNEKGNSNTNTVPLRKIIDLIVIYNNNMYV